MAGDVDMADAKRRAASDHILAATRLLIGTSGLDVTMEQIAEASGVSRRTLFRHFETRERLIATAFAKGMQRYGQQLPTLVGDDWRSWLRATCDAAHRMNASYGPGYWELTSRADLPAELAAVEKRRRDARRGAARRIAATLWSAVGRDGPPAAILVDTVGSHLSAHFTAAVITDMGGTAADAVRLTVAAIEASVSALIASG